MLISISKTMTWDECGTFIRDVRMKIGVPPYASRLCIRSNIKDKTYDVVYMFDPNNDVESAYSQLFQGA